MNNDTICVSIMLIWLSTLIISEVEYSGAVSGQLVHEYLFPSAYRLAMV